MTLDDLTDEDWRDIMRALKFYNDNQSPPGLLYDLESRLWIVLLQKGDPK